MFACKWIAHLWRARAGESRKRCTSASRTRAHEEGVLAAAVFEQAVPKPPSREEEIADIIASTHAARPKKKRLMTDEEIDAAVKEGQAVREATYPTALPTIVVNAIAA